MRYGSRRTTCGPMLPCMAAAAEKGQGWGGGAPGLGDIITVMARRESGGVRRVVPLWRRCGRDMGLATHLGDACVIPLERWRIASGTDALAPLRELALGVFYARREGRRAESDGGDGGGEEMVTLASDVLHHTCALRCEAAGAPPRRVAGGA